eukprot:TRINITY_DN13316_c0_g1_i4.p1 TRINITY_DN13316_c0_g1~~TRINITY_DN13316_c0_g1_i4.p1  ORF type:complete len:696 (+),score=167.83 TRINITY_DN13316_c0_g1_i4:191-2278(+)
MHEDASEAEARQKNVHAMFGASKQNLRADHRTSMRFDGCFGPQTSSQEVYTEGGIASIVQRVCTGYAATIFAYGQTGAGKSFSLLGQHSKKLQADQGGIIGLATSQILGTLMEHPESSVHATFSEIYAERVYDLFDACSPPAPLRVRSGAVNSFYVEGLAQRPINDLAGLLALVDKGLTNVRVGSHSLNAESNRSHRVLTLHVKTVDETGPQRYGKLVLVDLAGSEDVRTTGSSGVMLKEASNINKSLFCLGKVISSMSRRAQNRSGGGNIVPYRDSVLTKLLADSLGGSSLCLILACVSPSSQHHEETQRTLAFACRARSIKNEPVVVMDPQDKLIADLKAEIQSLRTENATLKQNNSFLPGTSLDGSDSVPMTGLPQRNHQGEAGAFTLASSAEGDRQFESEGQAEFKRPSPIACTDSVSSGSRGFGPGSSLLQDFDATAYTLPAGDSNLGSTPTRPMSPYSSLLQVGGLGSPPGSRVPVPKQKRTNPMLARQRHTLPNSAPPHKPRNSRSKPPAKKHGSKPGRAVSARRKRKPQAIPTKRQPPSEWAQKMVANAAAGWGSAKLTDHIALDASAMSGGGGGDPKAFDDWESRMISNWEKSYKQVMTDFQEDTPSAQRHRRQAPNVTRKQAQDPRESRYRNDVKGVGEGWNSSCLLYTSDAADEEDSVDLGGRRIIKKKKKKVKREDRENGIRT